MPPTNDLIWCDTLVYASNDYIKVVGGLQAGSGIIYKNVCSMMETCYIITTLFILHNKH